MQTDIQVQLTTSIVVVEQQYEPGTEENNNTTTNSTNNNNNSKQREKERSDTLAKATLEKAERDKKMSDYTNMIGNALVILALIAYIIVAWIDFSNTAMNRKTIVIFKEATTMKFPSLFFQSTEFGTLEQVYMKIYNNSCQVTSRKNQFNFTVKHLHNPSSDQLTKYNNDWVLVNSTLSYYNYGGYGFNFTTYTANYSNAYGYGYRRLLSPSTTATSNVSANYSEIYGGYYGGYYYFDYFSNYSYENSYYTTSASNIYYVYPPDGFTIRTNQHTECGDIFELHLLVSVPTSAFQSFKLSNFTRNLFVRSYPDSFGFQYGWGEKSVVQSSFTDKDHIYFSGRLPYGELRSEELQYLFFDDRVDQYYLEFYQSLATIDYTNINTNSSFTGHGKIYFNCYLYISAEDFFVQYRTVAANKWYNVVSAIGGMYGTLSAPIGFLIGIWLYGIAIACLKFEGRAPLDPLPEDLTRRLDGYIANKIIIGELAAGDKWKGVPEE